MATDAHPPTDSSFMHGAVTAIKGKGLKYSMVSVFNVLFGQSLLFIFVRREMNPTAASALSVCISSVPAYYMSRAWVWGKRGKSELRREILPFWIFVTIGLVMSTAFVYVATNVYPAQPGASILDLKKLLPNLVNIGAFGVLWVIRFFWMDKAFHLDHEHGHGPLDVLLDEGEPV